LATIVSEPVADPLEPECIVVPSRAMATWVSMRLSERHGIWAGSTFPFPRRFVHQLFEALLGDALEGADPFSPPRLVWSILSERPAHLKDPAFAEIASFVADDPRGLHRFELARRIASVFDQYLVFRPEMLLTWARGAEEHWQAR